MLNQHPIFEESNTRFSWAICIPLGVYPTIAPSIKVCTLHIKKKKQKVKAQAEILLVTTKT